MKITGEATFGAMQAALSAKRDEAGDALDMNDMVEIEVEVDDVEAHDKLLHLCDVDCDGDDHIIDIEEDEIADAINVLASGDKVTARILFGRAFQSYPRLNAAIEQALLAKDTPGQQALALVA